MGQATGGILPLASLGLGAGHLGAKASGILDRWWTWLAGNNAPEEVTPALTA